MNAYIVGGYRSPIGKAPRGSLRFVRPDDIAVAVIRRLMADFQMIETKSIGGLVVGNAFPEAEAGFNMGRLLSLMALDTVEVPGSTINRYCASGLESIAIASAKISAGIADVVIAGGANAKVFGDAGKDDDERIHWLGYVSDGELAALYQQAWAFVFPSIYEGFGIPPLEAMQWGCPVVAARAASIPEVCGDAALYFDPRNAGELVAALQRLAADDGLRQHLSDEGRKRAALFSWPQAARQVADVCRRALEEA